MGKLLPEAEYASKRSHRFEKANGGYAKLLEHARWDASNARYTRGACRCSDRYAGYGWARGYAARNAADVHADDVSRH